MPCEMICKGKAIRAPSGRYRGGCIYVENPNLLSLLKEESKIATEKSARVQTSPEITALCDSSAALDNNNNSDDINPQTPVSDVCETTIRQFALSHEALEPSAVTSRGMQSCVLGPRDANSYVLESRDVRSCRSDSRLLESRGSRPIYWQSHSMSCRARTAPAATTRARRQLTEDDSQSQSSLGVNACRLLLEKSEPDYLCVKKMYDNLLNKEQNKTLDLEMLFMQNEMFNLRRREMLHKKWTDTVYNPITLKVDSFLNPTTKVNDICPGSRSGSSGRASSCGLCRESEPGSRACRKQAYINFLQYCNKKGHVFLDTFDPSEYYPHPPKEIVTTGRLDDPLLAQQHERLDEDRTVLRCMTGSVHSREDIEQLRHLPPVTPQARNGSGWNDYMNMPISDIDSPVRLASRNRMCISRNQSTISFSSRPPSRDSVVPYDWSIRDGVLAQD